MPEDRPLVQPRGGAHKPINPTSFILEHLGAAGEDYIQNMYRAYKEELAELALASGRRRYSRAGKLKGRPYRTSSSAFHRQVAFAVEAGLIEFSHEEESDFPHFANWPESPKRRYYRLAAGVAPEPHVEAPKITIRTQQNRLPAIVEPTIERPKRIEITGELPLDRGRAKKPKTSK